MVFNWFHKAYCLILFTYFNMIAWEGKPERENGHCIRMSMICSRTLWTYKGVGLYICYIRRNNLLYMWVIDQQAVIMSAYSITSFNSNILFTELH